MEEKLWKDLKIYLKKLKYFKRSKTIHQKLKTKIQSFSPLSLFVSSVEKYNPIFPLILGENKFDLFQFSLINITKKFKTHKREQVRLRKNFPMVNTDYIKTWSFL